MKRASFVISITLLLSTVMYGQTPAAPATPPATPPAPAAPAKAAAPIGGSRFAVMNFMEALTGNAEGKKASERLAAETTKRQNLFQGKQKEGADLQAKLTTDKALTDAQKATISKNIEQIGIELSRMQEDFQKEITDLQQQLLTPIADKVKKEVFTYATENAFAVVIDTSGQADNVIYVDPVADITTEIIRRVDASALKAPSAAPAATPRSLAPASPRGPAAPPAKSPVLPTTKPPEFNG